MPILFAAIIFGRAFAYDDVLTRDPLTSPVYETDQTHLNFSTLNPIYTGSYWQFYVTANDRNHGITAVSPCLNTPDFSGDWSGLHGSALFQFPVYVQITNYNDDVCSSVVVSYTSEQAFEVLPGSPPEATSTPPIIVELSDPQYNFDILRSYSYGDITIALLLIFSIGVDLFVLFGKFYKK